MTDVSTTTLDDMFNGTTEDGELNPPLNSLEPELSSSVEVPTSEVPNVEVELKVISPVEKTDNQSWNRELSIEGEKQTVHEFGKQTYKYIPVMTDSGKFSDYYVCQCVDVNSNDKDGAPIEHISSGLLSKRYNVAIMETFINNLDNHVTTMGEPTIYHFPFNLNCQINTTVDGLTIFDEDSSALVLSLITGMDEQSLDNLDTRLFISANNNYSGARSLTVDMVLKTTGTIGEKEFVFKDFFTLSKDRYKMTHVSSLNKLTDEVSNVQERINNNIATLKAIDFNDARLKNIVKGIGNNFLKENKTKFIAYWENNCGNFKNLYNALLIASVVLSESYNNRDHYAVGNYINAQLQKVM